jgi:hypothetical protein
VPGGCSRESTRPGRDRVLPLPQGRLRPQCGSDRQPGSQEQAGGPERGYEGAKRLSDRKRHILLNTNGLVLAAARVHGGADLPDRDGGSPGWGCCGPTGPTPVVSASGPRRSSGAWRCLTAATGRAVALGAGGEAARIAGSAPAPLGGGEDLRVAEPSSASEQGLREVAGESGGHDLQRDEPAHAAQAGAGSVNILGTTAPTTCPSRSATSVCGGGEKKTLSSEEKARPANVVTAPFSWGRIRRTEIACGLVVCSSIAKPLPHERR